MAAKTPKLIPLAELRTMREQAQAGEHIYPIDVGADPEIVTGTGRATCRCCGEKIKKGEPAIKFYYDFAGCGSWTAVEVQIHVKDCPGMFGKE